VGVAGGRTRELRVREVRIGAARGAVEAAIQTGAWKTVNEDPLPAMGAGPGLHHRSESRLRPGKAVQCVSSEL